MTMIEQLVAYKAGGILDNKMTAMQFCKCHEDATFLPRSVGFVLVDNT